MTFKRSRRELLTPFCAPGDPRVAIRLPFYFGDRIVATPTPRPRKRRSPRLREMDRRENPLRLCASAREKKNPMRIHLYPTECTANEWPGLHLWLQVGRRGFGGQIDYINHAYPKRIVIRIGLGRRTLLVSAPLARTDAP